MTQPIDILRKGAYHWNQWRADNKIFRPDFNRADLIGVDLNGANLEDANLKDAKLGLVNLSSANLRGVDLRGADLVRSDLKHANLAVANLSGANLLEADLRGAYLYRTDLNGANLLTAFLSGADLTEANLSSANLKYTMLQHADFNRTNLKGANLEEADISGSYISGANISGANLTRVRALSTTLIRANLTEANLTRANFENANLSRADLTEANLSMVNLHYAILNGTIFQKNNFYKSQLKATIFAFTNLNSCKNLDSVLVGSPCIIDFETLRNSPNIPKEFLSKIGFTDSQIEFLPDFIMDEGIQLYPVFLSHASENKFFCGPLYEKLRNKGVKVWYDEKKIKPGDFIREEIHRGISLYDKMILICSKESLSSWWVEQEIDRYEEKERAYWKQHGEKISLIIPITIDDEVFTSNNAVAPNLRKRNIADFRNWKDENANKKAFEKLLAALNVNSGGIEPKSFLKI